MSLLVVMSFLVVMLFHSLQEPGQEDCYGTLEKLVGCSGYSKSDEFKKLPVLAQILSFL